MNAFGIRLEGEDVQQRERHGNIELPHHGIGPVVDRVFLLQIEFGHHQVDECDQIGDEDRRWCHATAETSHRQEEIDTCDGGDHLIDSDTLTVVHQTGELPDGQACDKGEQQDHRLRAKETTHDCGYEEHRCYRSNNEILHVFSFLFIV